MIIHRWFSEVFYDEIYKPVRKLGTLKTVIDLGSTCGEFSLWVYPQAEKIFAIEPHWGAFNHLAENVSAGLPKDNSFLFSYSWGKRTSGCLQ